MGTCAENSTIVKNWREHPPSSYSLKINKLSQLSLDKYESRRFLSGGYNWRLVIYPKGNEEDNGNGFISMYVEIDSTSLPSTPPTELFAYLIFFVYNKKQNKYFTIQDVEVKRFNALRTVWGLSQVLPLETFNDQKNGYIFEGEHCEFGADVMVASPFTKWEVVSFNEKFTRPKFSWRVKDFSVLKQNPDVSDQFSMGGREWAIRLYPKEYLKANEKWLSLFLQLAHSETLAADEKVYVRAHLQVLDQRGSNHAKDTCVFLITMDIEVDTLFSKSGESWGFGRFLSLAKLREAYLDLEDALNIEIEFEVVSATKYSPII